MILVELMTFKPPWDCAPVACVSLVLEGQRPKMPEAREPPAFLGSSSSNRFWPWGRTIALIRLGCELGLLFCFVFQDARLPDLQRQQAKRLDFV